MNAEQHYVLAEELGGPQGDWREADGAVDIQIVLARAQLHASLALAAELRDANTFLREIGDQLDSMGSRS